jgi:quercetin dioxygenase-like cupin family protein
VRRKLTCLVLLGVAIIVTALHYTQDVWATSSQGFVGTTLAMGRFGEIDVSAHLSQPNFKQQGHNDTSLSSQKAEGPSELYVESNVWQAGGSTGWHTHPGHSWIIVTEGTVTGYEGDDPDCKPHVYTQGMGFVDPGGDHVHLLRNEDPVIVAKTIAVQLIPAAAARRIDVADPGTCHF